MNKLASQWIQLTLVAVVVFLLVKNWKGVVEILKAGGSSYGTAVNSLQGYQVGR